MHRLVDVQTDKKIERASAFIMLVTLAGYNQNSQMGSEVALLPKQTTWRVGLAPTFEITLNPEPRP